MKKFIYEAPETESLTVVFEGNILSNVEHVQGVGGNGWYDEDYE